MTLLWDFITSLPALFKLLLVLQDRIKEHELENKVADDVQTIHEAFSAKDPARLNALFGAPVPK